MPYPGATHPRIYLTSAELTRLQALAAASDSRYLTLKSHADANIANPAMNGLASYLPNFALMYQVTGNTAYADKAIQMMTPLATQGLAAITSPSSGINARDILPGFSLAFDWCYARFSAGEKASFKGVLETWCDWIWPETNPARLGAWGTDTPGDNFYHGFMMTWLAGLALYGDSAKAAGYIDNARARFVDGVRPEFLDTSAVGGFMPEGTNYGSGTAFRILQYLLAHKTATGEDLTGFDWPTELARCLLYLTTPTLDRVYLWGDQPRVATAPLADSHRSAGLQLLTLVADPLAGYLKHWLDTIDLSVMSFAWERWQEFLFYRSEIDAVDYTAALARGYYAPGCGWNTSRSTWEEDAVYLGLVCGPLPYGDGDLAQNGFLLWRNGWLAGGARETGGSGLLRGAAENNSLTIGGAGQPEGRNPLPKDQPRTLISTEADDYAYFAGEAGQAYSTFLWNSGPSYQVHLNSFRRHLLFLKPAVVAVFDRVDAVDAAKVKRWHLNMVNEPTVAGGAYQVDRNGSRLYGTRLEPSAASVIKEGAFFGSGGARSSWRIALEAPTGSAVSHFLNVLEAVDDGETKTTVAAVTTGRPTSLFGAAIGLQVALFDTVTAAASISYSLTGAGEKDHFVCTLIPGEQYALAVTGDNAETDTLTADVTGLIRFTTGGGTQTITLTPAGVGAVMDLAGGSGALGSDTEDPVEVETPTEPPDPDPEQPDEAPEWNTKYVFNLGPAQGGRGLLATLHDEDGAPADGLHTELLQEIDAGSGSYLWTGYIPAEHRGYLLFSDDGAHVHARPVNPGGGTERLDEPLSDVQPAE